MKRNFFLPPPLPVCRRFLNDFEFLFSLYLFGNESRESSRREAGLCLPVGAAAGPAPTRGATATHPPSGSGAPPGFAKRPQNPTATQKPQTGPQSLAPSGLTPARYTYIWVYFGEESRRKKKKGKKKKRAELYLLLHDPEVPPTFFFFF